MRRRKYSFPINLITLLAVILLAIFLLIGYIWKVLNTSDFFSVKQVVVRNISASFGGSKLTITPEQAKPEWADYLKGRNIFSLDLGAQSRRVFFNYPDCRLVRFSRMLPDCIVIDFLKRQPVALIKFYKNFAVDEQGIFFYPSVPIDEGQLPVIYGLETKIFAPKPGVKYRRPELDLALNIIKELRSNKAFRGFTLKRIDAQNTESTGFFILLPKQLTNHLLSNPAIEDIGFEVRIGQGNIREKMMILSGLIIQARRDWGNIKYIDLRFKEPLIKLNEDKPRDK